MVTKSKSTTKPKASSAQSSTTAKTSVAGSTPKPANKPSATVAKATAGSDQVIGKDAKGRTMYRGPRGGEYYINASGNKEYTKKDN